VRFGSLADIATNPCDVCFTTKKQTFIRVTVMSALSLFDHLVGAGD